MGKLQFRINQKIEFINEEGQLGISLVQDRKKAFFLVTVPLKGDQRRLLPVGDIVTGIYYDYDDRLYQFNSRVLERIVENIPMYKLSMPENPVKVQRRDYVRIPVSIPINYIEITQETKALLDGKVWEDNNENFPVPWETGTALDISGDGINICTNKPIITGEHVFIFIHTDGLRMGVKGEVVRSCAKTIDSKRTYHSGIKFVGLSESDRDKIIGFIFKKFRERKQKGV